MSKFPQQFTLEQAAELSGVAVADLRKHGWNEPITDIDLYDIMEFGPDRSKWRPPTLQEATRKAGKLSWSRLNDKQRKAASRRGWEASLKARGFGPKKKKQ